MAVIAADRGVPFVAVPAGTLNHLARDLGLDTVDDAIAAVRAGTATRMDLGVAGDRCFVNTLTFGGYAQIVDARERLEPAIGKWPALLVALVRELPGMEPLRVEVDGRPMRVWLAWIGNCRYDPTGSVRRWREQLDDGLLDVRLVNGARRFSRTALHRRRAHRTAGTRARSTRSGPVESLSIRSLDGPLRLAADGETYDGPVELEVTKRPQALRVAVPPYERDVDARHQRPSDARPRARPAPPRRPRSPTARLPRRPRPAA